MQSTEAAKASNRKVLIFLPQNPNPSSLGGECPYLISSGH